MSDILTMNEQELHDWLSNRLQGQGTAAIGINTRFDELPFEKPLEIYLAGPDEFRTSFQKAVDKILIEVANNHWPPELFNQLVLLIEVANLKSSIPCLTSLVKTGKFLEGEFRSQLQMLALRTLLAFHWQGTEDFWREQEKFLAAEWPVIIFNGLVNLDLEKGFHELPTLIRDSDQMRELLRLFPILLKDLAPSKKFSLLYEQCQKVVTQFRPESEKLMREWFDLQGKPLSTSSCVQASSSSPIARSQEEYLNQASKVLARSDNSYTNYPANETPVFNRGEGIYLYDLDGVEYIDMTAGYGTANQGYTHPHIVQSLLRQANLLAHTGATLTKVKIELAGKLAEISPIPETLVHLDLGGSRATECAKVFVRAYTGKPKVISFSNSFHGRTAGSLSMYNADQYQFLYNIQKDYYTAPYPYCHRCAFDKTCESCNWECIDKVQGLLQEHRDVGGVIVEPALGEFGFVFPPMDFFKRLRRVCDEYGVLLISDEVQMGLGRLGTMFACNLYDTVPDLILLANSLAGTMWPLSAVLGRRPIMQSIRPGTLGSTFAGAPLACGVALASLEVFEMENLCQRSQMLGEYFLDRLRKRARGYPLSMNIDGRGLAIGIEFELPNGAPATNEVAILHRMALRKKLLVHHGGPAKNMLNMIPALTITREQIDDAIDLFIELLNDLLLEPKAVEDMVSSSTVEADNSDLHAS